MLRRAVPFVVVIAITSGVLIVALRGFAQAQTKPPGGGVINIADWRELKSPWDKDGNRWENEILKRHSKSYCVHHKVSKDSTPTPHHTSDKPCPALKADNSQFLIIPVKNTLSPSPTPISKIITGPNVTQQISYDTDADYTAIMATFK